MVQAAQQNSCIITSATPVLYIWSGYKRKISWILLTKKTKHLSLQLNAHGWIFFRTTMKCLRFCKHNIEVELHNILMRRVADPGEFSYIVILIHLSPTAFKNCFPWTLHCTSQAHNTQFSLNTVTNSAVIHILVGQSLLLRTHLRTQYTACESI